MHATAWPNLNLPKFRFQRTMEGMMTTRVQQIADQVKSLPDQEREEFLSWLADCQLQQSDAWDEAIANDAKPGGRLNSVLDRARRDIDDERTRPLDEVLGDS